MALTAVFRLDRDADLAGAAFAMARRFASGATLWCVAPGWPEHTHHVAVEFVHPVIMGKRALPSVSVEGLEAVMRLRTSAKSGDVLLAVAPATDPTVRELMRRAPAWGLLTLWIGTGSKPEPRSADHLLWAERGTALGRHDGSMVLTYHVLWELVHVCFEHPGLLREPADACDAEGICITCSDEGRLGEVEAELAPSLATVRTAQGVEQVDTTLVEPAPAGTLVLIHAGVAISRVES